MLEFYYPTTVLMLDDDLQFLENFNIKLSRKHKTQMTCKPNEAVKAILNSHHPSNNINNKKRHETISILIADYNMPETTGIEVCKKLKDSPCKKIILTGEGDLNIAINAFNAGLIDGYLLKGDPDLSNKILEMISTLQNKFFSYFSNKKNKHNETNIKSLLANQKFKNFFQSHIEQFKIKEFYLTETNNGYLLVDQNDQSTFLVITSRHQLAEYLDIASYTSNSRELLSGLQNKTKTPAILNNADLDIPASDWHKLLINIEPMNELPDYYFGTK